MHDILQLSRNLIAHEINGQKFSGPSCPAAAVCEKLRPNLATLMGETGFCALLTRALSRATAEFPELGNVQVKDGALVGPDTPCPPADSADGDERSAVLITQLLTLLTAFIGESLTLQLLREIWPELLPNDPHPAPGDFK